MNFTIDRNPIINVSDSIKIQTIGDVHLGKTFKTGVPSSKIGIREEMVFKSFEKLMNPTEDSGISHTIIMGDLFDKFIVSPQIILKTFESIKSSCSINPTIEYYLLPGNHDFSRDKTKVSSYELLALLLKDIPNLTVITHTSIIKRLDSMNVIYLDAYNPFHKEIVEEVLVFDDIDSSTNIYSFGHWDDITNEFGHYYPNKELQERSCTIISGHIHTPKKFTNSGCEYIYTGSLQPYSHAEDPLEELYQTIKYDILESLVESSRDEELVKLSSKNVRISCYPGYVFPHSLDCLSLTYLNNLTEESLLETAKPLSNISDFTTLYLHTLKEEHGVSMELLTQLNDFLKDTTSSVYFTLNQE